MKVYLLSVFLILIASVSAGSSPKPNVLLIYVDDLGYGDLGCYGHPVIQTPHLDQLASEGIKFTQHYAPSALCSPSRAALLTGRTPYRTGIKSWIPQDSGVYLRKEEITLAEIFKDAGYATALIGKWHLNSDLGNANEPQPKDHGFDYAYGANAFQIPTNRNPTNFYRNGVALGEVEGFTAQLCADESIQWLEKTQEASDTPFFLYLAMCEPHTTIENPDAYNAMYADYTEGEIIPIPSGGPIPIDLLNPRGPGEYYANITYMDHQIGRVLDALERLELEKNTMVVFASDNGPVTANWRTWWEVNAYGETGGYRGRKHGLYEGGLRVPAFIRYPPTITAGSETNAPSIGMDLFVTILKQAGLAVPDDRAIDGIDLSPLFRNEAIPAERQFFWALPTDDGKDYVYREGDWKLILNTEREPIELYDLSKDPLEFFDILEKEPIKSKQLTAGFQTYYSSILEDPLKP
ncbi:MAG: sulfatase-like hydrolase/transferase [Verrucomicrobiota bacterium]